MKIENASTLPEIFYGLHMVEGTAEYRDEGQEPYRIYLGETVLREMDKTFRARPVYVEHVDEVNLENLQEEADGYVIESFYNKSDGKHWAKFIVVSDKGKEAIRNGWKLSNAYIPKAFIGGGLCHGVEYQKEVTMGEYEHLAIVPNPRYDESIILTPENFKAYNEEKELELFKIANSKGEKKMSKYNFFKRAKIENAVDVADMSVTLPLSKTDKTVSECVEIADKFLNMNGYANGDHMVKVGEDEMSVNELVEKHCNMMKKMNDEEEMNKKKNAEEEEKKKNAEEEEKKRKENMSEEEKAAEAKKNADEEEKKKNEEEEKKKNAEKEAEEKKQNALHFEALKNAPNTPIKDVVNFEMSEDRVARGKTKYGSN